MRWVDIATGTVWQGSLKGDTIVDARLLHSRPGTVSAVLSRGTRLILTAGTSLVEVTEAGETIVRAVLANVDSEVIRFNDAKLDPFGNVVAGTMAFDASPHAGALYRLNPWGDIETLLNDLTISNGLAWSADGLTMFFIDSPTGGIDAFDYSPSEPLKNKRRFAEVASLGPSAPDGMCIDSLGRLWAAVWGASEVQCFSADGELVARVEVDAPNVSSCAFVGQNRDRLMITTSQQDLSPQQLAEHPGSGSLFLADVHASAPAYPDNQ